MSIANAWWTLLLPLAALTAMLAGAPRHRLWMAPVSALVFTACQWSLPKCRFRSDRYLSPVNIALFLMLLKLVAVPALIGHGIVDLRVLCVVGDLESHYLSVRDLAFWPFVGCAFDVDRDRLLLSHHVTSTRLHPPDIVV